MDSVLKFNRQTFTKAKYSDSEEVMDEEQQIRLFARVEALQSVMLALIKTHPDKGALAPLIQLAAETQFDNLLEKVPQEVQRATVQAEFDVVFARALRLCQ